MSGQPKFCVDCRHYDPGPHDFAHCRHPAALVPGAAVSPVTGKPEEPFYHWPETMRLDAKPCGTEGKLFEPKPTIGFA
jgi:hypothetical protein